MNTLLSGNASDQPGRAQVAPAFARFVGDGLRLTATGIVVGLAGALLVTQMMESLLVGVTALDPMTYVATAIVLTTAAAAASYVPAHRATTISPVEVLRAP